MGDQHKMFSDIVHLQTLSSCVGNCSDGLPVQFGIATFNDADASKAWLSDSNNGGAVDLTGSDQGAYSDSAINTYWCDVPSGTGRPESSEWPPISSRETCLTLLNR